MLDSLEIDRQELAYWTALVDELLDVVARRIRSGWSPVPGSQAEREIRATAVLETANGAGVWGREPAETVYAAAEILAHTVLSHVRSLRTLLATGWPAPSSVDALARSALEATSTIWWLTCPHVSAKARIVRLYELRRKSAVEFEKAVITVGVPSADDDGTFLPSGIDKEYRDNLGLQRGSAGQKPPRYGKRVEGYLKAAKHPTANFAVYNYLSGSAHGELWRLQFDYAEMEGADGVSRPYQFYSRGFLRIGIAVAVESLFDSIRLPFRMLGRGASILDLSRMASSLNQALAPR